MAQGLGLGLGLESDLGFVELVDGLAYPRKRFLVHLGVFGGSFFEILPVFVVVPPNLHLNALGLKAGFFGVYFFARLFLVILPLLFVHLFEQVLHLCLVLGCEFLYLGQQFIVFLTEEGDLLAQFIVSEHLLVETFLGFFTFGLEAPLSLQSLFAFLLPFLIGFPKVLHFSLIFLIGFLKGLHFSFEFPIGHPKSLYFLL